MYINITYNNMDKILRMKNVKGENPLKQEIKTIQGRKRWTKLLSCSKKNKNGHSIC